MTEYIDRSDECLELYGPVDGAELLDDIKAFLTRFVVYPSPHALVAHVLWIVHTWLMVCWDSTPRIAFLSPEPGSGKSRALEVTEPLVPRPVHAVNTTSAYLFRKVADPEGKPTILYDEIDTVFGPKAKENEDIRGMLNAGHRKGAKAGRCVVRGKVIETEELDAYCAVMLPDWTTLPGVKRCHRLGLTLLSGRNMAAIDTTGGRSSLEEGESQRCVMKRLLAVVMIVSAALLSAPVASADPGWGHDNCDYGGYCGNDGGGWDNGYYGGWYPGKWLFGGSGCVSGPFGFVQLCK
jgi:hypothetical protein